MKKIESIVAVAVPAVAAIWLGVIGKQLIIASVDLPTSYIAGMVLVSVAVLCGILCCIAMLLVKLITNQKK